jgi:hypothetical protein
MKALAHGPRGKSHLLDVLLPIVTLGFYGLRRFRPRRLYVLTALLILALWLGLVFVAGMLFEGGELFAIPLVFIMTGVTFLRLVPAAPGRMPTHR